MSKHQVKLAMLVAAVGGLYAGTARADNAAPAPEAGMSASAPVAPEATADQPVKEEKNNPMSWFGIGLKMGVAGNGEGEFEAGGVKTTIDSRTGFNLALPLNLGGDGFSWDIEPYLTFSSVDGASATGAKKSYGVTTFGAYTGPFINFHVIHPLYVGFGLGPKIGYISSDAFDMGADIFVRAPLRGTYYLYDDLGLVAELGLGYGMTGYASVPTMTDPDPKLNFGTAMTWDFSVGARWL